MSGTGRKLKELSPRTKIVAVDPVGSILAEPPELNEGGVGFYNVEGIGYVNKYIAYKSHFLTWNSFLFQIRLYTYGFGPKRG